MKNRIETPNPSATRTSGSIYSSRILVRLVCYLCLVALVILSLWIAITFHSFVSDPMIALQNANLFLTVRVDGREANTLPLPPNAPVSLAISDLLQSRSGKWRRSYISYAPRIYITSESFNINIQPNKLIINLASEDGTWSQVETEITIDQFTVVEKVASEHMK
jgi:hypothetical protein